VRPKASATKAPPDGGGGVAGGGAVTVTDRLAVDRAPSSSVTVRVTV
jgi:hypothetical protein